MSLTDVRSGGATQEAGITPVRRGADMPVSHTQQRLWFIKQMDPNAYTYNLPVVLRLTGRLDTSALEQAFNDLVARHEAFRTQFVSMDGTPRCTIDAHAKAVIEHLDVSQLASELREQQAMQLAREIALMPFDLTQAPLLHIRLVRIAGDQHLLCLVFDHIVADGISVGIFVLEFQALYGFYAAGTKHSLKALPIQYLDYAEWERGRLDQGALEGHLAYWKKQLGGLPSLLELPTDRPRPSLQTFNGARLKEQLSPELSARVKAFARTERATPFIVMLAAFQVLLSRYSGTTDIATGSAVANRGLTEVEGVVGFFANNVVLRSNLAGNPTVRETIARVRDVAMNAYAHEEMPFDLLVDVLSSRRELGHSPLFQVMFVLHNVKIDTLELTGLKCDVVEISFPAARFDLAVDVFDTPQGIKIYFEYNTDLFDAATIDRMLHHYVCVLDGFTGSPDARIGDLRMLSDSEMAQIVDGWNRTDRDYAVLHTVHALFEQQAALRRDAEAVRCGDVSLSYKELNERANQLARYLRSLGVDRGSLVGIEMERAVDLIVALLAVLKAGAGYVPMDPAFPKDRIAFIARDASLDVVLTQSALLTMVPAGPWKVVAVDRENASIGSNPVDELGPIARPGDLAYVIYTSGSTGQPKGVEIEHRSFVNFLSSMQECPGISAEDRFVSVTTLSFDIAGLEIFGPLLAGGTVILADRATALDGAQLIALLDQSRATILQATPATWRLLLAAGWLGKPDLKALCGGEALPRDLAEALDRRVGELWNMYGPTETTIWSTMTRTEDISRSVSIGAPDREHACFCVRTVGAARTDRCVGRALHCRRRVGARLSEQAGIDGREIRRRHAS